MKNKGPVKGKENLEGGERGKEVKELTLKTFLMGKNRGELWAKERVAQG